MIRPMRDEVERYGHQSPAAGSMYDHTHQWASERTAPNLARVGGRYSDEWRAQHLRDPQIVVPESVMPECAFLADAALHGDAIGEEMAVHAFVGVPCSDEMLDAARADFWVRADPGGDYDGLLERHGEGVQVRDFDGQPELTEMDGLIACPQIMGTLVDFTTFTPDPDR